jgi:hypothetical protein
LRTRVPLLFLPVGTYSRSSVWASASLIHCLVAFYIPNTPQSTPNTLQRRFFRPLVHLAASATPSTIGKNHVGCKLTPTLRGFFSGLFLVSNVVPNIARGLDTAIALARSSLTNQEAPLPGGSSARHKTQRRFWRLDLWLVHLGRCQVTDLVFLYCLAELDVVAAAFIGAATTTT